LSYSASSPGIETVEVSLENTETGEIINITRPADNTAILLDNLAPGTKYKATVRSKTADGKTSEPTLPVEFTTKTLTKSRFWNHIICFNVFRFTTTRMFTT